MLDPIDRLLVDPGLMAILTARVGATAAADLLDDLAHGVTGADRRLAAVLGTGLEHGQPAFLRVAGVDLRDGDKILDYMATLGPGIGWNGRHLVLKDPLPETMTLAMIGQPLGALIRHPQLDPAMTIAGTVEDAGRTRFRISDEDCRPITIRQALDDQAERLTDRARRRRSRRRRIRLARIWRTSVSISAGFTMVALIALGLGSATGILFDSLDARIAVTAMALIPAMTLAPLVKHSLILSEHQEAMMREHYGQMAFETRRLIEDGSDASDHFALVSRLL